MNKEIVLIILSILMLTIVLGLLILVMHEVYVTSLENMGNRNKMVKQYKKDIASRVEKVNVNNRVIVYQHFDSRYGYSEERVTPEMNPVYKDKTIYFYKKNKNKYIKGLRIFLDIFFIVIFLGILGFNIYSKVTNSLYSINGTTYITVATGSMATKNEENTYLTMNSLDNQIKQFSLIGLKEVKEPSNLKVYGIYAYKNEDNQLIVHRIIKSEVIDNEVYYTFRGDANPKSDYFLVNAKDVLYEYTGYQNVPLGYFLSFLSSIVGITALIYIVVALSFNDYFDSKKEAKYRVGLMDYLNDLNKEETAKLYSSI